MSPELAVAVGGALGAPARYLLDAAVPSPYGIVLVNLLGSLVAGVLAGVAPDAQVFLVVGVLGSFTTASTVAWDVLGSDRAVRLLALHLLPGLGLAAVGFALGRAL